MKLRFVVVGLAAIALAATCGCGQKGPKLVKISGKVQFKDGTLIEVPADTGNAMITFQVVDAGEAEKGVIHKAPSGKIGPDGRFEMMTFRQGDGVIPGKYIATIVAQKKYMDLKSSVVPAKYGSPKTSGLPINVDKPKNDVLFELDKQ